MPIEPSTPSSPRSGDNVWRRALRSLLTPRAWWSVRRKRFWLVVAVAVYALAGYFAVPALARREIVDSLQKMLNRPVALAAVRVDPFVLSADLRGFRIDEADGSPLVGWDRLYVRFSLASLWHRAWSFDTIKLNGLKGSVVRFGATDTNIGRLIDSLGTAPEAAPSQPAPAGLPRVAVRRLEIANATADIADYVAGNPFRTTIGPVTLNIAHFSTLPQATGAQHLAVELEGGAKLEWTATSGVAPLVSAGHVTARGPFVPLLTRYFGDAIKLAVPTGSVTADLDYRLQVRPDGVLALAVDGASFALDGLTVREPGADSPFLVLPEVRLQGGHLAWPEKTAGADSVTVGGLDLVLLRQANGQIGPESLSAEPPAESPAESSSAAAAPAPAGAEGAGSSVPAADWTLSLGKVEVKNARLRLDDRAVGEPGVTEIAPIDLTLDQLSNQPGAVFPFSLAAGVPPDGRVQVQGHVTAFPDVAVDAKLAVANLPLIVAQRYVHDFARLAIRDGRLDTEADVTLHGAQGLTVVGRGAVRMLKLDDEVEKSTLLSWTRLGIDRYDYRQAANDLQISRVTLEGPYLRFQVAADQSTNFGHLMAEPAAPKGHAAKKASAPAKAKPAAKTKTAAKAAPVPSKAAAKAKPASNKPGAAEPAMAVSVGRLVVSRGTADYGDASLPLPFAVKITDLKGEVASLASTGSQPARVALRGQVGAYGQAKIEGHLTPFDPSKATKIALVFRNVDFPNLSPYTAKFAGRRIAKGRLDVDLQYAIDNGKLNGANRVVIRDMELGEKVDVPGALDLPLDLAIALLKDSEGKIDVDLAVSGNLDDPQFDIGSVVVKAVFRLLTDLVTAPFRALASLFGGGDDLGQIAFAPGRSDLDPPEREKILHLAQTLEKRPSLRLVVPEVVDPDADRAGLQQQALDARMARELGDRDTVKRQHQFLESLFDERIGKDRREQVKASFTHPPQGQPNASAVLDEGAYATALREAVAKTEPVDDAGLARLALARAEAVVAAMKQVPGFDPRRVGLGERASAHIDDDGAVPLQLDAATMGAD